MDVLGVWCDKFRKQFWWVLGGGVVSAWVSFSCLLGNQFPKIFPKTIFGNHFFFRFQINFEKHFPKHVSGKCILKHKLNF